MIKAAVLGSPIAHSLSPLLHTIAYAELGIEGDYTRVEIKSGELSRFLESRDDSWTGLSLTMPLKEEVLDLTQDVSDLARRIRSANTLIKHQGVWKASTTDVSGFTHTLAAHGIDSCGDVLIIGGGATARAAAAACDGVASRITVMIRSESRIEALSNSVEKSDLDFIAWDNANIFENVDLIISTTPKSASDSLTASFPSHPTGTFFDVLYNPWPTLALEVWSKRGAAIIDGLDLLIHQGIDQVSLFSGISIDRAPMAALMRRQALSALGSST